MATTNVVGMSAWLEVSEHEVFCLAYAWYFGVTVDANPDYRKHIDEDYSLYVNFAMIGEYKVPDYVNHLSRNFRKYLEEHNLEA